MVSEKDGKIYIFTDAMHSVEFRDFVEKYHANTSYYAFEAMGPLSLFAGVVKPITVWDTVIPGSVVFRAPNSYWMNPTRARDVPNFLIPQQIDRLGLSVEQKKFFNWSLGFIIKDKPGAKYFVTCAHSVKQELREDRMKEFAFITAYGSRQKLVKLCSGGQGYYGPYEPDRYHPIPYLIDILFLRVTDDFLSSPFVDMCIRKDGIPFELEIYEDDMEDLRDMTVSVWACMSGKQEGTGVIIDIIDGGTQSLCMEKDHFSGLFVVLLLDQEKDKRIAVEGDSGALIFGNHPKTNKPIAVGLVFGGNDDKTAYRTKTGVPYQYVTYCTTLKHAKKYSEENLLHYKFSFYDPNQDKDSGFSSGPLPPSQGENPDVNNPDSQGACGGAQGFDPGLQSPQRDSSTRRGYSLDHRDEQTPVNDTITRPVLENQPKQRVDRSFFSRLGGVIPKAFWRQRRKHEPTGSPDTDISDSPDTSDSSSSDESFEDALEILEEEDQIYLNEFSSSSSESSTSAYDASCETSEEEQPRPRIVKRSKMRKRLVQQTVNNFLADNRATISKLNAEFGVGSIKTTMDNPQPNHDHVTTTYPELKRSRIRAEQNLKIRQSNKEESSSESDQSKERRDKSFSKFNERSAMEEDLLFSLSDVDPLYQPSIVPRSESMSIGITTDFGNTSFSKSAESSIP